MYQITVEELIPQQDVKYPTKLEVFKQVISGEKETLNAVLQNIIKATNNIK